MWRHGTDRRNEKSGSSVWLPESSYAEIITDAASSRLFPPTLPGRVFRGGRGGVALWTGGILGKHGRIFRESGFFGCKGVRQLFKWSLRTSRKALPHGRIAPSKDCKMAGIRARFSRLEGVCIESFESVLGQVNGPVSPSLFWLFVQPRAAGFAFPFQRGSGPCLCNCGTTMLATSSRPKCS